MPLIFQDAATARDKILEKQQKEIVSLYNDWAKEIGEQAKYYKAKETNSSWVSEQQSKMLRRQLKATAAEITAEIEAKVKNNIYAVSEAVVLNNKKFLKDVGFTDTAFDVAFSSVPKDTLYNLVNGNIYDTRWSLSEKIWGNNEKTLKDIYGVVAKGLAQNKPIYDIAKNLEAYVKPGAKLPWNLEADGVKIFKKKVDYNAQRLARTLVQHGYQTSFIATTESNPFITSYKWNSNGSRACELCIARDGKIYKKDELPMDHPNGMCTMIPTVDIEDTKDQLVKWFNNEDGTYPEIDNFAKSFGYEVDPPKVIKIQTTAAQQANYNANKLKAKYLKAYGYGPNNMPKSFESWIMKLSDEDKAQAIILQAAKEPGLSNYNAMKKFYKQNILDADNVGVKPLPKVFNDTQDKYLSKYGFTPDKLPDDFNEWSHMLSHDDVTDILKAMGTDWSDPHPYQQIQKFYNDSLINSKQAAKSKILKVEPQPITPPPTPQPVTPKVKAFNTLQDKYLGSQGYNNKHLPKDFKEWIANVSENDKIDILKLMGTGWNDPHPYQTIEKFFNNNLIKGENVVKKVITPTPTPTPIVPVTPVITKPKMIKVPTFTKLQDKMLGKYGYTVDDIPDFITYAGKVKEKGLDALQKLADAKGLTIGQYYKKYLGVAKNKNIDSSLVSDAVKKKMNSDLLEDPTQWINTIKAQRERDMLAKEAKSMQDMGQNAISGLRTYTSNSGYQAMNTYMRNRYVGVSHSEAVARSSISDDMLEKIKHAKDGLNSTSFDEDLVLRRGSDLGELAALLPGDFESNKRMLYGKSAEELHAQFENATGELASFTSTSSIWDRGFTGSVEVIYYAPKGTNASSIMTISNYGTGEGETLLNAGTKLRCIKVEKSDGHMSSSIRVFMQIILN